MRGQCCVDGWLVRRRLECVRCDNNHMVIAQWLILHLTKAESRVRIPSRVPIGRFFLSNENYGGTYLESTVHTVPARRRMIIRLPRKGAGAALIIGSATLGEFRARMSRQEEAGLSFC